MAQIKADEITQLLREQIANYDSKVQVDEVGTITSLGDGIARLHGLDKVMAGELLAFPHDIAGLALSLEEDQVGAVVLGDYTELSEGQEVKRTGKILSVPVGEGMIGRVVNALGQPIDDKGPIASTASLDTIINNAKNNLICIYCAIGQKRSSIAQVVQTLTEAGAMGHTIIVAASASEPAPMLYIAPYAATAIGEYFRDSGRHALVMYDDLSKHAMAYREISLLLRRPPGREAYPGDVFYLETDLSNSGVRPAVNVGLSVSRVGFSAAIKAVKQVGSTLKLDLAQYRELAAFAQFGSDLDLLTQKQLNRGQRLTELLKQPQFQPLTWQQQAVVLFAGTQGYLDDLQVSDIRAFEDGLYKYLDAAQTALLDELTAKKAFDDDLRNKLHAALKEYSANFKAELEAAVKA